LAFPFRSDVTQIAPDLVDGLHQPARLHALRMTGLLDSAPEAEFDRLTRLAARVAGAPTALLTLVDGDRQFFKSTFGLPSHLATVRTTPVSHCLCKHTVLTGQPLLLDDTSADETIASQPAVRELGIGAYAGVPLVTEDGHVLGSLCVIDFAPHEWPAGVIDDLADLARTAGTEIALRRRLGERARLDEALRSSERRFRELVEAAHEGIWALDAVGRSTYVNPRMAAMLGYDAAEITGRLFFDFMPPAAAFEARTLFARRQRGIAETHELAFRRRDGAELWALVSASPLHDADGLFVGAITHVSDITERRRAEEALRRRDEQYRLVTDGVPVLISYFDADERYQFVNRPYATAFARAPETFVGLRLSDVIAADEYVRVRPHLDAVLAGRPVSFENVLSLPAGARHIRASYVPHFDARRVVIGFFALIADTTEQRALEEQLRQAQKMEAVGRLAGGVAHDFNNLLTVITANTTFAREALSPGSLALEDLEAVDAAAARAAALSRQLLAFSRQQVLRPQHLDVNAVVANVERMLRRVLGADVTLQTHTEPSLHQVHADTGQLEQVLMNLAMNARDAMPRGGTLTIRTRNLSVDAHRAASTAGLAPGEYAVLSVTDTGVGMDDATRARVFEPFFTTKEIGRGTGLGLATVYGIVQQSGGHVSVESVAGRGSAFTVYLPRHAGAPDDRAGVDAAPAPDGAGTVLLVEDEAPVRAAVRRMLERGDYAVLEAANGSAALAMLASGTRMPDLVLTDVVMPEMGAHRMLDRLRAGRPDLAVLLMSGYSDSAVTRPGPLPDGVEVLSKPFTQESLLRSVRRTLDARRPA
jgi:two-component system, cell cycle sensor histidine kinase and response regulator CckA